jgi:predicted enzyme related to lactoylglutathione lyase
MVFVTGDIEATVQQMKANGVTFKGEIERQPFGAFITFIDPDGNEFLLKGD